MVAKVGSETTVDTKSTGTQDEPHITALGNGNTLATWISIVPINQSSSRVDIEAQVLDPAGGKVGDEVTVASGGASGNFYELSATTLANGDVLVSWSDDQPPGEASNQQGGVSGRLLSGASGAPIGDRFRINAVADGPQDEPDVAALAGGGFVATYRTSPPNNNSTSSIVARVFTPKAGGGFDGGAEIPVASGKSEVGAKVTALSNGGFAVAWSDGSSYPATYAKLAIYGSDDKQVGSTITLNTQTSSNNDDGSGHVGVPDVQALRNGTLVVSWSETDMGYSGSYPSYLRYAIYKDDGTRVSDTGPNSTPYVDHYQSFYSSKASSSAEQQANPSIASTGDGGFVISYDDNRGSAMPQDADGGVNLRRFDASGKPIGDPLRVNTSTPNTQRFSSVAVGGTAADPDSDLTVVWADGGNGRSGSTPENGGSGEIRGQAFSLYPVFQGASVSGDALTLNYNVALDAEASHLPATSAFAVKVDGADDEVTAVSVDGNAVRLALTTAVAPGQSVTVAYADPTPSADDTNAIQDAAGSDARSLPATAVGDPPPGGTPAPVGGPGPAPPAGPSPAPQPSPPSPTPQLSPEPIPAPSPAPQPAAPGALSVAPSAFFDGTSFVLSGAASSRAGVAEVRFSAVVDGARQDLGAARVDADGRFSFADAVGAGAQSFIEATLTDGAGRQTTAPTPFSFLPGGGGVAARQESYSPDGDTFLSSTAYRRDGSSFVNVAADGATVRSNSFDIFANHGHAGTAFVFDPGYGLDVVRQFQARGPGHDTLDLPSSDFASIADVLRHTTANPAAGTAAIHDPVSGDTIRLTGAKGENIKAELARNPGDFAFHG